MREGHIPLISISAIEMSHFELVPPSGMSKAELPLEISVFRFMRQDKAIHTHVLLFS